MSAPNPPEPVPAAQAVRRKRCPKCKGFGLTGKRDQWGFGIACPKCEGTGVLFNDGPGEAT